MSGGEVLRGVVLGPWQLEVDVRRRRVGDVAQRTENTEVRHSSMR
jgi:hypothetical protein